MAPHCNVLVGAWQVHVADVQCVQLVILRLLSAWHDDSLQVLRCPLNLCRPCFTCRCLERGRVLRRRLLSSWFPYRVLKYLLADSASLE